MIAAGVPVTATIVAASVTISVAVAGVRYRGGNQTRSNLQRKSNDERTVKMKTLKL